MFKQNRKYLMFVSKTPRSPKKLADISALSWWTYVWNMAEELCQRVFNYLYLQQADLTEKSNFLFWNLLFFLLLFSLFWDNWETSLHVSFWVVIGHLCLVSWKIFVYKNGRWYTLETRKMLLISQISSVRLQSDNDTAFFLRHC